MIHFGIEPWGEHRADLRAADNTFELAGAFWGKMPDRRRLLYWQKPDPEQEAADEEQANVHSLKLMFGAMRLRQSRVKSQESRAGTRPESSLESRSPVPD